METKLNIDSKLLEEAQKVGGACSRQEVVHLALTEFIQRRRQLEIVALFGTIVYDEGYDYKSGRQQP